MDDSGLGGGILSGPASRFLDLDLNPSIQRPGSRSHQDFHHNSIYGMGAMRGREINCSVGMLERMGVAVTKGVLGNCIRRKGISAIGSNNNYSSNASDDDDDDDELSFMEDGNDDVRDNGVKGKKGSLWQRMKWTDKVVRLLIMVVSCVGDDDGVVDGVAAAAAGLKRKSRSLQQKGKWKMVSGIMMERGCYVSPQQCEDKFNDLNKRYKCLNEILGRGISCQVMENPILLVSINHIPLKMKDTVRKILSSKHLFYREMCAYHNGQRIPEAPNLDLRRYSMPPLSQCFQETNGIGEEDDDDSENGDCDDDWENVGDSNGDEYVERIADLGKKKINAENCSFWSPSGSLHDDLGVEIAAVVQETAAKSPLEHQDVSVQAQVFELEIM